LEFVKIAKDILRGKLEANFEVDIESFLKRWPVLNDREKAILNIIDRLRDRINELEKSLNRLRLMCSLSFLFSFLLIGHISHWI
jgi:hypothetical protein